MPWGKKYGGRKKGVPNKAKADFRTALTRLLNAADLEDLFEGVPHERRLEVLGKLAEFAFPKLGRTEVTGKDGAEAPISIVFTGIAKQ